MMLLIMVAVIGLCIAIYTYFVETRFKADTNYKPICDLSDRISCSKPMKSAYTNVFFFSNSVVGIVFYVLVCALALIQALKLLLFIVLAGCIGSCYLAYLLYFRIKALCLLCTALYIVNGIMLYLVIRMVAS